MNRKLIASLAASILTGILLVVIGTIYYKPLVTIGASLLSGSIVGVLVSYSQANISVKVSNIIRNRELKLYYYKKLVEDLANEKGQDFADDIARYYLNTDSTMRASDYLKVERSISLIKESKDYWEPFHAGFQGYVYPLREYDEAYKEFNNQFNKWLEDLPRIAIDKIVKCMFTTEVILEFFQNKNIWNSELKLSNTESKDSYKQNFVNKLRPFMQDAYNNADKSSEEDLKNSFCINLKSNLGMDLNDAVRVRNYSIGGNVPLSLMLWLAIYDSLSNNGYRDALIDSTTSVNDMPHFKLLVLEKLPEIIISSEQTSRVIILGVKKAKLSSEREEEWSKFRSTFPEIYNSYELPEDSQINSIIKRK